MKKTEHKGHLLCVDFESWIFSSKINARKLTLKELKRLDDGYTPKALNSLLKLLRAYNQKVTFFVVTKLDEIYSGIIDEIVSDGHEVAWHTHTHQTIISTEILKHELEAASKIIEKYKMKGFQAPSIYFIKDGYKILKDYGFMYSSSIYGNSNKIYKISGMHEIPVSTIKEDHLSSIKDISYPVNMSLKNIIKHGLPIGSSFFWGILKKKFYDNELTTARNNGNVINTFIHEWQLYPPTSPEYLKDVGFFWNPFFMPYKINVLRMFEQLLANHKFQPLINHINFQNEKKKY